MGERKPYEPCDIPRISQHRSGGWQQNSISEHNRMDGLVICVKPTYGRLDGQHPPLLCFFPTAPKGAPAGLGWQQKQLVGFFCALTALGARALATRRFYVAPIPTRRLPHKSLRRVSQDTTASAGGGLTFKLNRFEFRLPIIADKIAKRKQKKNGPRERHGDGHDACRAIVAV